MRSEEEIREELNRVKKQVSGGILIEELSSYIEKKRALEWVLEEADR